MINLFSIVNQIIRYADAVSQTEQWLSIFNDAADKAKSSEDIVFECCAPLSNAEFWYRTAKHEGQILINMLDKE